MITRRHAGGTNITRRNCDSLDLLGAGLGSTGTGSTARSHSPGGRSPGNSRCDCARKLLGRTKQYRQSWTSTECFEPAYNPLAVLWVICYFWADGYGEDEDCRSCAEVLFGDPRGVIKVDCAEFQHSHENREADRFTARLFGAPRNASCDHPGSPGAISHRDLEDQLPVVR